MDIEQVIRRLQDSEAVDLAAFEPIIEEFKDRVYTVCYRMIGNIEDAKDISQDTFVEVFVKLKTLQAPEKFSAWIYKIVVNKCLNYFRKREKTSPLFEVDILVTNEKNEDFVKRDLINHLFFKFCGGFEKSMRYDYNLPSLRKT